MPVLISYSHKNADFAEKLAQQIFLRGGNVWIDRWEISPGDSIYESVQDALAKATAVIAILTKESVASVWCKREVAAAMGREADEKRIVVIPVLLEDCDIPLFLRDKLYADFRTDFDSGMALLMTAIAKFSTPKAGRVSTDADHFLNDYSYDYNYDSDSGKISYEFHLFQHSNKMPISVYTSISLRYNEVATQRWARYKLAGIPEFGDLVLSEWVCQATSGDGWLVLITDAKAQERKWIVSDRKLGMECEVIFKCRRLGDDTGRDTAVRGHVELQKIVDVMKKRIPPPTREMKEKISAIIRS